MSRYIAITGAAGFIGTHVTEALVARGDYVYAVDAMTYAAKPSQLYALAAHSPRLHVRPVDVRTLTRLPDVDAVVHLAASTHVDNSLSEAKEFVDNNVGSTAHMLELVRAKAQHGMPHYVHISTDEVYGSIPVPDAADEDAPLRPSSPYAASKAAADMLVQAWATTYSVPATILRPTNCYGSGQYAEKLIPKVIRCAQLGRPFPIHGDGTQTRCWLSVADLVTAVLHVIDERLLGVYNVGGNTEAGVAQVVSGIHSVMFAGPGPHYGFERGFERLACDHRYAVDDRKLRATGWVPVGNFWADLPQLVAAERNAWQW